MKLINIFLFLLIIFKPIFSKEPKTNLIILNFVNETKVGDSLKSEYDFLGKKIADEFRYVFGLSNEFKIYNIEPIYQQLAIFQRLGFESQEKNIYELLEKYKIREESGRDTHMDYTHIVTGKFSVKDGKIFIQAQIGKKEEKKFDFSQSIDKDFPEVTNAEYWKFNACSKAVYIITNYFQKSFSHPYLETCNKPNSVSAILEASKTVYNQIKEIEKELAEINLMTNTTKCPRKCLAESDVERCVQCLEECEILADAKRKNFELVRVQIRGYKDLEDIPNEEGFATFKKDYLPTIIQTLKALPEGAYLAVQGRISKKFSGKENLHFYSEKKAKKAFEFIVNEISKIDSGSKEYLKKLKPEACADVCMQEFPEQIDSSYRDNTVTFRIRTK